MLESQNVSGIQSFWNSMDLSGDKLKRELSQLSPEGLDNYFERDIKDCYWGGGFLFGAGVLVLAVSIGVDKYIGEKLPENTFLRVIRGGTRVVVGMSTVVTAVGGGLLIRGSQEANWLNEEYERRYYRGGAY